MADQQQPKEVPFTSAFSEFAKHVKDPDVQYEPLRQHYREIKKDHPTGLTQKIIVQEMQKKWPDMFSGIKITGLDAAGGQEQPGAPQPAGPPAAPATGWKGTVARGAANLIDYGSKAMDFGRPLAEGLKKPAEELGQLGKGHGKPAEIASGFAQGIAEYGIDMSSLQNIALAGASVAGPGEIKGAYKLLKYAPSLIRGVFTGQMLTDLANQLGDGFTSLFDKGDYSAAGKYAAKAIADAYFIRASNKAVPEGEGAVAAVKREGKGVLESAKGKGKELLDRGKDLISGKKTAPPPTPAATLPEAKAAASAEVAAKPKTPKKPATKAKLEAKDFPTQGDESYTDWRARHFEKGSAGWQSKETGGVFTDERLREMHAEASEATPAEPESKPEPKTEAKPKEESNVAKAGPKLPEELAGAKPNYHFGQRKHELNFSSDIDKAAYITAGSEKSKADAQYLKFVMDHTGLTKGEVRMRGRKLRDEVIKGLSQGKSHGDTLEIPETIKPVEKTKPVPEKPKAAATKADTPKVAEKKAEPKAAPAPKVEAKKPAEPAKPAETPIRGKRIPSEADQKLAKLSDPVRNIASKIRNMSQTQMAAEIKKANLTPEQRQELIDFAKGKEPTKSTDPPAKPVEAKAAAEPPAKPEAAISRGDIAERAATDIVEQAKAGRDEHAYPFTIRLRDGAGKEVLKFKIENEEDRAGVEKEIAKEIENDPSVESLKWETSKGNGVSFLSKHVTDLKSKARGNAGGSFVPGVKK